MIEFCVWVNNKLSKLFHTCAMTAAMTLISIGLTDKNNKELFAGDKVQIVNGANAGKILYKIRAAAKAYTVEGDLSNDAKDPRPLQVSCKKIIRLTQQG